ncbi:MAG: S-layer homology domain-containing protein [Pseudomonadota bacterium]
MKKFPDVPDDHWAAGPIKLAAALGIVSGFPDGTFRPDAAMTRAQGASMTIRSLRIAVILAGAFALGAYAGAVYAKSKG